MTLLDSLPVWGLAIAVFFLRIIDVSVCTLRTIAIVQGRMVFSVCLGFCEVLIWVMVVGQVLKHATDNPLLLLTYASGFACGNAVGILIERQLALGSVILRIVSVTAGPQLAELFRDRAARVFTFDGRDSDESMMLIYVVVRRRMARELIEEAQRYDPELFFAVDPLRETNAFLSTPLPNPSRWRGLAKMK